MTRDQKPAKPLSMASRFLANQRQHRSTTNGQFISRRFAAEVEQQRQAIRQALQPKEGAR